MDPLRQQWICIIDFGSQYTQLIARRIREIGVYCEIHSAVAYDINESDCPPSAVILSGGPQSAGQQHSLSITASIFDLGVPVLGICYGMQRMVQQLGGVVQAAPLGEFGHVRMHLQNDHPLFAHIDAHKTEYTVWMSHGDHVITLPPGFTTIAASDDTPIAGIAHEHKPLYGLQFHPEVTHTEHGSDILRNFVLHIAGCHPHWQAAGIVEDMIKTLRTRLGEDRVLLALSGGVDSAVAGQLLHRAIGKQLHCVLVDNGLLRLHEADQVIAVFDGLGVVVQRVNAQEEFMTALHGVTDPEQKRTIIGHTFIEVFERTAQQLSNVRWLAQGTIYSDVIESATGVHNAAHTIKSHHNVGGLPERMSLKLVEPLRNLFKDEVRNIGRELGMPDELLDRHPFPGPGLGVRILGQVTAQTADILRQADDIFMRVLHEAGWLAQVSQAFAVFLPVNSVGVTGDHRRYAPVIALRAVVSEDFMTASAAPVPHDVLSAAARQIVNSLPGVSRVVYDITDKPPATIEWE